MEVPNALVASLGLAVMTVACAIFICRPLHPLLSRLLPKIGGGVTTSQTHTVFLASVASDSVHSDCSRRSLQNNTA